MNSASRQPAPKPSAAKPAARGANVERGGAASPARTKCACACGGSCPRCAGEPLSNSLRAAFEPGLGQRLDKVSVRASDPAPRRAGVRAFATHDTVAFGGTPPAADRIGGRFLLAHELAHVAQLRGAGRPAAAGHARDAAAEREADHAAVRLAFGLGPATVTHRPAASALLASPLSDSIDQIWLPAKDKGAAFDALRAQSPAADPDLDALLARIFAAGSDDLWLAQTIVRNGPEPLWPARDFDERRRRQRDHGWAPEPGGIQASLLTTTGGRSVDAYYFPGTSDERALVIAGVHGSEQGGIQVAEMLIQTLTSAPVRPYYSVIVVPTLFPDNAALRQREFKDSKMVETQTNRNFPHPGQSLDAAVPAGGTVPMDAQTPAKAILPENIALMRLIERFRPSRIASVHGSTDANIAGIFGDAHTVSAGATALAAMTHITDPAAAAVAIAGLEADAATRTTGDETLAIAMARDMKARGFERGVLGNKLSAAKPNPRWKGGVRGGTSLGGWAPQDITEGGAADRPSMTLITIETDTNARSTDLKGKAATARKAELAGYRDVIQTIFLGPP